MRDAHPGTAAVVGGVGRPAPAVLILGVRAVPLEGVEAQAGPGVLPSHLDGARGDLAVGAVGEGGDLVRELGDQPVEGRRRHDGRGADQDGGGKDRGGGHSADARQQQPGHQQAQPGQQHRHPLADQHDHRDARGHERRGGPAPAPVLQPGRGGEHRGEQDADQGGRGARAAEGAGQLAVAPAGITRQVAAGQELQDAASSDPGRRCGQAGEQPRPGAAIPQHPVLQRRGEGQEADDQGGLDGRLGPAVGGGGQDGARQGPAPPGQGRRHPGAPQPRPVAVPGAAQQEQRRDATDGGVRPGTDVQQEQRQQQREAERGPSHRPAEGDAPAGRLQRGVRGHATTVPRCSVPSRSVTPAWMSAIRAGMS